MKIKKFLKGIMAGALSLSMALTSMPVSAEEEIVTEVPENTEITFWHAMNAAQEEALTKITEDFMEEYPNITVKLENQSNYGDLSAKITTTLPSPDNLPTITQAYPGWLYDASEAGLLVDLTPYIEHPEIGWGDNEEIIPGLMEGAKINGVQYGIPFNKSTEMIFYNVDMLEEYGQEVPTNFDELKEVSKAIYEQSNGEVVGLGFDSLNNYYAICMKNRGHDITPELDFAGEDSKEVISYYLDGIKEGYFRIAGSDNYMSTPFGNQQVAMFIGSIAGETYVQMEADGKFEYDVAPRPEPINIQQGTDVYMFDSATPEQKTAAFTYMKYLASPDVQLYWAQNTGYMPILESVVTGDEYLNTEGTKVPQKVADSIKEVFAIPADANAVYSEIRPLLEGIFADPDQDLDKALEAGQETLQMLWEE